MTITEQRTLAELAAAIEPKPGSIIVLGGVASGKTLTVKALLAAYERQGTQVRALDDATGTEAHFEEITAVSAAVRLDDVSLGRLVQQAALVISFRMLALTDANRLPDFLDRAGFNIGKVRPENFAVLEHRHALAFRRCEGPALTMVELSDEAPQPVLTPRIRALATEINRRCHPGREPEDIQSVAMNEQLPHDVANAETGMFLIPGGSADAARKLAVMGAVAAALPFNRTALDLLGGLPDIATINEPTPSPVTYVRHVEQLGYPVVFMALRSPVDVAAAVAMSAVTVVVARLHADPPDNDGVKCRLHQMLPEFSTEFTIIR